MGRLLIVLFFFPMASPSFYKLSLNFQKSIRDIWLQSNVKMIETFSKKKYNSNARHHLTLRGNFRKNIKCCMEYYSIHFSTSTLAGCSCSRICIPTNVDLGECSLILRACLSPITFFSVLIATQDLQSINYLTLICRRLKLFQEKN